MAKANRAVDGVKDDWMTLVGLMKSNNVDFRPTMEFVAAQMVELSQRAGESDGKDYAWTAGPSHVSRTAPATPPTILQTKAPPGAGTPTDLSPADNDPDGWSQGAPALPLVEYAPPAAVCIGDLPAVPSAAPGAVLKSAWLATVDNDVGEVSPSFEDLATALGVLTAEEEEEEEEAGGEEEEGEQCVKVWVRDTARTRANPQGPKGMKYHTSAGCHNTSGKNREIDLIEARMCGHSECPKCAR
jgi:hypothetical protein